MYECIMCGLRDSIMGKELALHLANLYSILIPCDPPGMIPEHRFRDNPEHPGSDSPEKGKTQVCHVCLYVYNLYACICMFVSMCSV